MFDDGRPEGCKGRVSQMISRANQRVPAIEALPDDKPGAVHRSLEQFPHIFATHKGGEIATVNHAGKETSTWGVVVVVNRG